MGLLDDLQVEVKHIRAAELDQNAELEAQKEFYSVHLRPAMLRAYEYCSELVESLNVIASDIKVSYPLNPSLKNGVSLQQSDYKFSSDCGKSPRQVDILCSCNLEHRQEFYVRTEEAAEKLSDLLESFKFPYHRKNTLDKRYNIRGANFILEGPMKVHIRILAHAADRCVYIGLRNLEDQPIKRYKFAPEKLSNESLERLARLLIREELFLVEAKQVPDDVRDELRRQVELDKIREEEDLAQAHADLEAERLAEKEAKLVNRIRRKVAVKTRGVMEGFSKK
jgi:hypothetical protein